MSGGVKKRNLTSSHHSCDRFIVSAVAENISVRERNGE